MLKGQLVAVVRLYRIAYKIVLKRNNCRQMIAGISAITQMANDAQVFDLKTK